MLSSLTIWQRWTQPNIPALFFQLMILLENLKYKMKGVKRTFRSILNESQYCVCVFVILHHKTLFA